jgi:hypothetical protein
MKLLYTTYRFDDDGKAYRVLIHESGILVKADKPYSITSDDGELHEGRTRLLSNRTTAWHLLRTYLMEQRLLNLKSKI